MRSSLASNGAQARQTKQIFARPEEQLSFELGKAVQELPPLYTRLLAGTISAIVVGAIAWANFSKVDEVATAPGELIASAQVRPITSIGNGSILAVRVKEGQRILKDQILVERDPEYQKLDVTRLAQSARLIQQDLRRLDAERTGSKNAGTPIQDELLASRLRDFEAKQRAAEAEASRLASSIDQAKVKLVGLQENLVNAQTSFVNAQTNLANARNLREKVNNNVALAKVREQSMRTLIGSGAVPRLDYLQAQDQLNRANAEITRADDDITNNQNKVTEAQDKAASLQKGIAAQVQEIKQAQAAFLGAKNQAERLASERQSEVLTQINKRREEFTDVSGKLDQARKQTEYETIKSPVAGTVYKIKATKGPVQSGEELLSILPDGEELQLEVKVLNRDIGFIRQGMKAKVKMATFPFQEFGTIEGEVVKVSPNAIVDKDLGLVFPTRIKLSKHSVILRGQEVQFTPGMSANGEIVTRQKSVLTFITEPISRRFEEAFSVR